MLVVVDVNVILSALLGKGDSFNVFAINNIFNKFDFIAPEFLFVELEKHKEEFLKRSRLSKNEFEEILKFITNQISIIPKSEFENNLPKARELLLKEQKDAPYVALALELNCPIFSGDKKLREVSPVKILSPKEMLSM